MRSAADDRLSSGRQGYTPVDPLRAMEQLESNMFRHALVAWVGYPLIALVQELLPIFHVTCEHGYPPTSLIFVALVELHHIFSESMAWSAAKSIPTVPELSVLRTYGVLRKRSRRVFAGLLEGFALYFTCILPVLCGKCDDFLTQRYVREFDQTQLQFFISTIRHLRFSGVALIFTATNVFFSGAVGMFMMCRYSMLRREQFGSKSDDSQDSRDRISGSMCIHWAHSAQTAMMPSVAAFFEEMASQKRFVMKDGDTLNAVQAMQARRDAIMGKMSADEAQQAEIQNIEELERVMRAERRHTLMSLFVKVLVGNLLQLTLVSVYFELTFDMLQHHTDMMVKLICAMVILTLEAIFLMRAPLKSGPLGLLLLLMCALMLVHAGAKVYFAFRCESHLWTLFSGCIAETTDNDEHGGNATAVAAL